MHKRLEGKRILITRAYSQQQELSQRLQKEGAIVFEVPTINIVLQERAIAELEDALDHITDYHWLILTSVNTVSILQDVLQRRKQEWSLFAYLQIACIGKATANRVRDYGGNVVLVPSHFQAEGLAEELLQQGVAGEKVLLPRAEGSREILPQLLTQDGAAVHEIHVYRAELPEPSRQELLRILREEQIDFITFTSSSTVRNFMDMARDSLANLNRTKFACIGPITAATLREYGFVPSVIAEEFTIPGLVEAIASADPASYRHQ